MTPCKFNPRCLCSNSGKNWLQIDNEEWDSYITILVGGDGLGAVECSDVLLADLPPQLEDTRVFALTLRGNGLRKFPVGKLREMGETVRLCKTHVTWPLPSPSTKYKPI